MPKIQTITQAVPPLLTWLVAETCLERAGITPTKELVNGLVAKANFHFNTSEGFKKGVKSKANNGNAGRDCLYAFMEMWVNGKYWERHELLPKEYAPYQEQIPEYKQ